MAEREHFTNFRCITFGTGFAMTVASFGAQVAGWQHWISIGIGYGIGIVLMLIAAVLISKSYFSKQSEPLPYAPPTEPSRLKIISAYYGADGGPDVDVLDKYIKPRVHGDAFVGWAGADLFGGFQPVINAPKRLRVRYSFDGGEESTVIRHENEMLVLPEDRFLKEQIAIERNSAVDELNAKHAADIKTRLEQTSGEWDRKLKADLAAKDRECEEKIHALKS